MKLMLDHTQRLNLHALLGAQRADVGSIRAIWAIQDRLALSADEEKAIELKRDGDSDDVDQSFRSDADQSGAKRRRALSV